MHYFELISLLITTPLRKIQSIDCSVSKSGFSYQVYGRDVKASSATSLTIGPTNYGRAVGVIVIQLLL